MVGIRPASDSPAEKGPDTFIRFPDCVNLKVNLFCPFLRYFAPSVRALFVTPFPYKNSPLLGFHPLYVSPRFLPAITSTPVQRQQHFCQGAKIDGLDSPNM
jgi:hypothetical protein